MTDFCFNRTIYIYRYLIFINYKYNILKFQSVNCKKQIDFFIDFMQKLQNCDICMNGFNKNTINKKNHMEFKINFIFKNMIIRYCFAN